jgi:hypothetical protein
MTALALIATRKGLFKVTQDKQVELVAFLGVPVSMMLASKQYPVWYAALDHGHFGVKLHRSDDRGETWQEMAAPAYPKAADADKGESLELIWSLAFAEANNSQALWAGTIPGGLFYSPDGGQSWVLNESLWQFKQQQQWFGGGYEQAGIHSICVRPDDPAHISLAVSCAGVWVSRDKGGTWENQSQGMRAAYFPPEKQFDPTIQDPHRMVQCANDTNTMWVQHHNGIFRSVDGAASWQELEDVKPSSFGFAVAVHPNDGDTAWFVPGVKDECRVPVDGQFAVTRTRDGGQSFEVLSEGLPQEHSYDLVYRHALDVDSSGEQLIMGSTTGNLWYSEDQGDSWQNLSNYLPPILAVSFIK